MNSSYNIPAPWDTMKNSAALVLADGNVIHGIGLGAYGEATGEVCFNTAMTGYQEILTDPSYAQQIITFTFPHIGNVGANPDDIESLVDTPQLGARGCIVRGEITRSSNYRALENFDVWLKQRNIIAMSGVDTRALTTLIRKKGMLNAIITHKRKGDFNFKSLKKRAALFKGLTNLDLVSEVTSKKKYVWTEKQWNWNSGYRIVKNPEFHVVAIDYGIKKNILRCLATTGCRVTVVQAMTPADVILAHNPDGIFLSNGPGDPEATGIYAVPEIIKLIESGRPIFGICLGHQILCLAMGAKTSKMHQGHHGANHPVQDKTTGKVEITSMNHGFTVDRNTLPNTAEETHISLFDGTNCGIRLKDKPVFSVQYHPEASPGPQDGHHLFSRFASLMRATKAERISVELDNLKLNS
ncbi:MAG: glutamine-hydrolyzing carbamoyl-phosphate synthase small subunit [Hyphomicrobiaceae bacterium]|nr:glutamine-hydrolyzing carbamoyl-phosphate synthase small subunit [Hyphomicrobiaceae bacterium]